MNPHAMHLMEVAGVLVGIFFILIGAFLAIDQERIIKRLDGIRAAIEASRKDAKQERQMTEPGIRHS